MNGSPGILYNGKSSAQREVVLRLEGERLRVSGAGIDLACPVGELRITPQLGSIRRSLRLPNGVLCETGDERLVEALLRLQGRGLFGRLLHRWESSLRLALLALGLLVLLVWGMLKYGIPYLARQVAFAVPQATETTLGRETLSTLDRLFLSPSKLPEARRQEIQERFRQMTATLQGCSGCRLELRASEQLGANAFALPSGIIVVTDGLVELARRDEELVGVLAHEFGHVTHRHSMRHVLQNSATGLIIAAISGDILSASSLAAGLPTALINAKFSRDFELEADDAALAYLEQRGINPRWFAEMLARLQAEHDRKAQAATGAAPQHGRKLSDFLSTHPVTRERIERLMRER